MCIASNNRIYYWGDTITIEIIFTNNTLKDTFFILDLDKLNSKIKYSTNSNYLRYSAGGDDFEVKLGYFFTPLKIILPKQTTSKKIYFDTKQLPEPNKIANKYNFFTYFGYFKFSNKLLYLTKPMNDRVIIKDFEDYNYFTVSHVPIQIGNIEFLIASKTQ